jgi:hypothetical protein
MNTQTSKVPTEEFDMFHTMQDFMSHVKGFSYVMAGVVMLAFIGFWFFLTNREKKKK